MQTIRLRVSNNIYSKLIWLLSKFKSDELEIITEDNEFISAQSYLNKTLTEMDKDNVSFDDINTLENKLNNAIKKHEN